jgi:hypothetical protein
MVSDKNFLSNSMTAGNVTLALLISYVLYQRYIDDVKSGALLLLPSE